MKVLLVNKFHYMKGGSETYYFALGNMLKERGVEVIYFSMKHPENLPCDQEQYFVDNIDYNGEMSIPEMAKASAKLLYSFEAKHKFAALLDDEEPDIIHLNIFQSQLTGSIVDEAVKRNIPIVYTAHDLKAVCPTYLMMNHGQICDACLHGHYLHCIKTSCMKDSKAKSTLAVMESLVYKIKRTYRHMDLIITPSMHHKRRLEEAKVTEGPIRYMANFLPVGTEFKNGTSNGQYFLYFGRLSREKGVLTLIKGYAASGIDKPLYIVGRGPEEEEIRELIHELNLEEKVPLLGFKTGQDLKDVVANAHCVCMPSECCENAPYSIMEAQAAGRPAIVSRNGGLPELVTDGESGYVFTPNDVEDLAEKIRLMDMATWDGEQIVEMARKKYSAENYVKKLMHYYKKLIDWKKRGR